MPRRRWAGSLLLALSLPLLAPLAAASAAPATSFADASTGTIADVSATAASSTTSGTASATDGAAGTATASVPLEEVTASVTQVASGLRRPIAIAAPDDGTGRLFIAEKSGTVRVYHPDTGLAADPILDITSSVAETGNERGLIGMALAPDFADSQELYLAYTALPDAAVTLGRYSLADGTLEPLISQEHAEYSNHNGGQLTFGPDGYLYWAIGDGGGSGDPYDSGQRLDTLLGKIMRVDVSRGCGDLGYCVPEDNPFVGVAGAREEIWITGVRNPWRFSFDEADGSLWIGDVGQGSWEEIDHLARGEQAGANLGWSCHEGYAVLDETQCDAGADYTEPVFTYSPHTGGCAVIGGRVYHGEAYADLVGGTYIATDYCSSTVWALRPDGDGGYLQAEIGETPTQVTAFGTTPEGEFYVVNDLPGGLHRVSFERTEPVCTVSEEVRVWGTGMTVDLTITNNTDTAIDGWSLEFPLPWGQTIVSDWATDLSQFGDMVTATNGDGNGRIEPGASVTFGYLAEHTEGAGPPGRYLLNEATCAHGD